jgi:ATP-binding cassette, subfamily B, bacterial MsbA
MMVKGIDYRLGELIVKLDVKVRDFIFPIILSFLSTFFDGVSITLLIPSLEGIIRRNFGFIRQMSGFAHLSVLFPGIFDTDLNIFISLIFLIIVSVILKNVFSFWALLEYDKLVIKTSANLRNMIYDRFLSFGKYYFDQKNQGYLNKVLFTSSYALSEQIRSVGRALYSVTTIMVYVLLTFFISIKIAVLSLLVLPILYMVIYGLIKKIERTSKEINVLDSVIARKAYNTLSCMPLIKSYHSQDSEKAEFSGLNSSYANLLYNMYKKWELIYPLQEVFTVFSILIIASMMTFMVLSGEVYEISGFFVFFYLLKRSQLELGIINQWRAEFAGISGQMEDIFSVLDDKDKYFVPDGGKTFPGLEGDIVVRGLNFSYDDTVGVLKNLSLRMRRGEVTAIVGQTGSGKTTLVNLFMRFYDCPPGTIFIDGVDIRDFSVKSLMDHIAMVTQDPLLFNDTIKENLVYGLGRDVSGEEIRDVLAKARLLDYVLKLPSGVDTTIGDRGIMLSGGEKQRLAIARAMLKGEDILILDEATSSLDSVTEKLVQDAIDEAIKGKTAIVIAHRLSTIKNADRIIVLGDGRIVEEGTLQELLGKNGEFHRLWSEQKFT